jgi:hypothetical protein
VLGAEAFVFGFSFLGFRTSLPPRFFSFDIVRTPCPAAATGRRMR